MLWRAFTCCAKQQAQTPASPTSMVKLSTLVTGPFVWAQWMAGCESMRLAAAAAVEAVEAVEQAA